ncbi:hypothetical protein [Ruminiclostridium cellulolyticum]|uniref:hypothetical protein n=1 Tax=Ruminiclostridium cellulolyticum TaxID=1521 RepID=UPI0002E2FF5B|nr:hypothetical protein [Ruminiclostridium cellulolyticum]
MFDKGRSKILIYYRHSIVKHKDSLATSGGNIELRLDSLKPRKLGMIIKIRC